MKILSRSIFTAITVYTVLFGLLNMITPSEVERSKWISFQEWLGANQKKESNQEKNHVDLHSFESWTDFHSSQTATHVVVKSDNQQKIVSGGISILSPSIEVKPVYYRKAVKKVTLTLATNLVEPLISGIAIGAP